MTMQFQDLSSEVEQRFTLVVPVPFEELMDC